MITIYGETDTGLVRKSNQDRFDFKILSGLLAYAVLCDGMGGQSGGHIASETATSFVAEALARDLKPGMGESSLRHLMLSAAAGANALVFDKAMENEALAGMGTTIIIAVFEGDHAFIAHAGDSRAYCVSGGRAVQLTRDHTVVQMLLDIGEISPEDARNHPKRHYITRAVGVAPGVDADFIVYPFAPGDLILLCSDGLYNYIQPQSMPELLAECAQAGSVQSLIALARERGGGDNITAVLAVRK